MTDSAAERPEPLTPLVSALLARAHQQAEQLLALARSEADEVTARAQQQADALLAEARAKGVADGEAVVAGERARAERAARGLVLDAQRQAYDQARRAARDAVSDLRHDPDYPDLRETLRARATRDLGPDVRVAEDPRGGIVAASDGRRVDYSFDALADDIVDRLAAEVEGIWST